MTSSMLIYGATGYTAGLVLEAMARAGLRPMLAARNAVALRALAERTRLPERAFSLDDASHLRAALQGVGLVLNLAGPFVSTAESLASACVDVGAHYLDVSGEVDALRAVAELHGRARARGVMLMPGVGFDVVPSDCLCAHASRRVGNARRLRVGISGLELASRGSLKTLALELGRRTRVRRARELREVTPGDLTWSFDFGAGPTRCTAVSWGDLITAPISTGASEVETYFELTPAVAATVRANRQFGWAYRLPWVREGLRRLPEWNRGPTAESRASRRAAIVVEAESADGRRASCRLITPEAYSLTAETATRVAARVAAGDFEAGFQTPSRIFGADFILAFAGVTRVELEASSER